jgi:hypothetical protein
MLSSFQVVSRERYAALTATAPFLGMDREWTDEEKAGLSDALRKFGWK